MEEFRLNDNAENIIQSLLSKANDTLKDCYIDSSIFSCRQMWVFNYNTIHDKYKKSRLVYTIYDINEDIETSEEFKIDNEILASGINITYEEDYIGCCEYKKLLNSLNISKKYCIQLLLTSRFKDEKQSIKLLLYIMLKLFDTLNFQWNDFIFILDRQCLALSHHCPKEECNVCFYESIGFIYDKEISITYGFYSDIMKKLQHISF